MGTFVNFPFFGYSPSAFFASLRLCLILPLLAGWTSSMELRRAELAQLAEWLPGRYDNVDQSQADRVRGAAEHEALAVAIVPIYAPALGERVFYSQEMAAGDERRVLGQRILAFEATKKGVVMRVYALDEPARWRDGHLDPDLFKSLMPQDVKPLTGCDLAWKKDGERFTGANDRRRCRTVSRITGSMVNVDSRMELGPSELAMSDRSYAPDGRLVYGNPDEPFYRFAKRPE
jgi:hypothetical protein